MLNGTLGTCKTDLVEIELKEDGKPIFWRPYQLLKVNEEVFKKEVEILVSLRVVVVANHLEWGSPSLNQSTPKSNRVRFLSDFRNLNKQFKRIRIYYPKNHWNINNNKKFQYSTSLDLNMR